MNKASGTFTKPQRLIATEQAEYDAIGLQITWSRLISIADDAANALVRSAFSNVVREANDYTCGLMDDNGDCLVESTGTIPCFSATLPNTVKHFLTKYGKDDWRPGDYVITNDPWMGTGHLPDINMATPIFVNNKLVAFAGMVAHATDMGGTVVGADTQQVFQEGLRIPIMRIVRGGRFNEALIDIIKANVRVPDQVMGDIHALITAGEVLVKGVVDFMEEQNLQELSFLGATMQSLAEEAMRNGIRKMIPDGVYTDSIETDGWEEPIIIKATIIVRDGGITVDYTGTSTQLNCAVNSPMCYTYAYTAYPFKCIIDPEIPRNEGSYRPIKVIAPLGTVLNPRFPAATNARLLTGHFLSSVIYGALCRVIPDKVIAESGGAPNLRGLFSGTNHDGGMFCHMLMGAGGMGARPNRDGLSCTGFPSNSIFGSVEAVENETPLIFWQKEIERDSGGPGTFRGGCGQQMVIQLASEHSAIASFRIERIRHPALGMFGGFPGSRASVHLYKGTPGQPVNVDEEKGIAIDPKGQTRLMPGDTVKVVYPGAGGYGRPEDRDRALVLRDLKNGIVSLEKAREAYKLVQM